ncbi:MAG: hypothetical protein AAGD11_11305 [Planctomycetota bacterium]
MTEGGQVKSSKLTVRQKKSSEIIGDRKGVPIYRSNPSVPDPDSIGKKKKVRLGDEKKGLVIDPDSGEVLNVGGATIYQLEEVDDTKFVKLFLAGVKQTVGLSKIGLTLFEIVYYELQSRPGEDEVKLNFYIASEHVDGLTKRHYRRGLRELLDKEFLFRSPSDGVFFVNILYMFNGDRLAFVKAYKRKSAPVQSELEFKADEADENK